MKTTKEDRYEKIGCLKMHSSLIRGGLVDASQVKELIEILKNFLIECNEDIEELEAKCQRYEGIIQEAKEDQKFKDMLDKLEKNTESLIKKFHSEDH